jgi:hypothetical protein
MKIRIVWTEDDIDHIKKHGIEPGDVESIFESKIYYRRERGLLRLPLAEPRAEGSYSLYLNG